MNIFEVTNQKGGVGKTSFTFNIASILALHHKKRVLVIDADGQANLTLAFGKNPDEQYCLYDYLITKNLSIEKLIIPTNIEGLDIIPSNDRLFSLREQIKNKYCHELTFDDLLRSIKGYDFALIDTPPQLDPITINSIVASDNIFLVAYADEFSVDAFNQFYRYFKDISNTEVLNRNKPVFRGVVQNRYDPRLKVAQNYFDNFMKNAQSKIDFKVYTPISQSTIIQQSQIEHTPLFNFSRNHNVTKQFINLTQQILDSIAGGKNGT